MPCMERNTVVTKLLTCIFDFVKVLKFWVEYAIIFCVTMALRASLPCSISFTKCVNYVS